MRKYELSYSQQALYFVQQFNPPSTSYNVGLAFKFLKKFNDICFRAALDKLLLKHRTLCTRFLNEDGKIYQYIDETTKYDLHIVDIRGMDEGAIERKVNADFHTGYNLLNDNLLRVYLYRNEAYDLVSIVIHHIIADFNSVEIILNDFMELYHALENGFKIKGDDTEVSYDTFVEEEKEFVLSKKFIPQMQYWENVLMNMNEGLDFDVEAEKAVEGELIGAKVEFQINDKDIPRIYKLCEENHISTFIFFLTIYKLFLFQVYGKRDVVVGVPVSLRRARKYKRVIGNFTNLLPIRMRTEGGSFIQNAKDVNSVFVEAMLNKKVPYLSLVQHINPSRSGKNPFFQTTFNYLAKKFMDNEVNMNQSWNGDQIMCGYEIQAYAIEQQLDQMDMSLEFVEHQGGFTGIFKYDRGVFNERVIKNYVERFIKILLRVLDCAEASIENLKYSDENERNDLIFLTGQRVKRFEEYSNVIEMIEEVMDNNSEKIAVRDEQKIITYQQLREQVNVLAWYLKQEGVKKGNPIIVYMNKQAEVIVAFLAIMKIGAIYVPIDTSFPKNRIEYIFECTSPSIILTNQELIDKEIFLEGAISIEHILNTQKEANIEIESISVKPEDSAYIIFTSGSTGKPKGVEIQHMALVNFLQSMREILELKGKKYVNIGGITSIAFDISILEFLLPLTLGGQSSLLTKKVVTDVRLFDKYIREFGINVFQATATTWTMLLKLGWKGYKDIGVLVGGEMVSKELAHDLTSKFTHVWNVYGPTEATIWATAKKISFDDKEVTVGFPIHNMEAYILDNNYDIVQKNVAGKLYLAGIGLAKGYYNREELTKERFFSVEIDGVEKRIYDTGDIAKYLNNGEIQIIGRVDDQVKLSGYRIELGEIESVLNKFTEIRNSAVLIKEQRLVAYIVYDGEQGQNLLKEIREFCKKNLISYMIPTEFVQVSSIPLTPNQKTDRKMLSTLQGKRLIEQSKNIVEDRSAYEEMFYIWKDVLGNYEFGIDDNFFDIGGTSLLAMTLQQRIKEQMKVEIELPDIFTYTTIRSLSDFLKSRGENAFCSVTLQKEIKKGKNRLASLRKQKDMENRIQKYKY